MPVNNYSLDDKKKIILKPKKIEKKKEENLDEKTKEKIVNKQKN